MSGSARNLALYPWFRFATGLTFWQAVWFLYFQAELSAAEAILLYIVADISTTLLEVPSGYVSDRVGRRVTLIAGVASGMAGALLIGTGGTFWVFAAGQILFGAMYALLSGTDSALLYESLVAEGREEAVELHELRAWRRHFTALALSAVSGGVLALWGAELAFLAAGIALAAAFLIALAFDEPSRSGSAPAEGGEALRFASLGRALREPVLRWLFALSVAMYAFSHVPFVFGQPFILEALEGIGLATEAPLVSGAVTAAMMLISVAASLGAPRLRGALGLGPTLLLAFSMQIALIAVLASTGAAPAIAILFLRMVPDSLSRPFITARIQPLLSSEGRATYLSLQSLCGRLALALTLYIAAGAAPDAGTMAHDEIRRVLGWYTIGGLTILGLLAFARGRVPLETPR